MGFELGQDWSYAGTQLAREWLSRNPDRRILRYECCAAPDEAAA